MIKDLKQVCEEILTQTVLKMLAKGVELWLIMEVTGLTREQIEKLSADDSRVSEPSTKYKACRKAKPRGKKSIS